ncbi:unnamed protein product [Zymoseptoria tritici ST99CH_1A5]|uniref:Uncharacterized protein n=1 Tax=Zymoseptoria tritici ST99CH_1A5 TaxID=1276529 RepID=A0A1Y6LE55_ZYMTR|nr:unnamed protein product [Zymoseptoria tritici ST99CH_1A5]
MPPSSLSRLLHLSPLSPSHLDHLHRLLSTASGLSSTLLTLQYTLALLHVQLTRLLTARYQSLAESIATKASATLAPGEVVSLTIEPPHLALTDACLSVRSAGEVVDDWRTASRVLTGGVGRWAAGRGLWREGKRDPALKGLAWVKVVCGTGYWVLESAAFGVKKGVIRGEGWKKREAGLWKWSCRFWLGEVVVEFLRLARVRSLRWEEEFGAERVEGEKEVEVKSVELEKKWWRELYAYLGWLPGALHWSFDVGEDGEGLFGEGMLAVSGLVPGVIALQDNWRETA